VGLSQTPNNYNILSGTKLIESMRYGGYKNPAYAIAELIDNSIEAGAKAIEMFCKDELNYDTQRKNIKEIAVLDNGGGMNNDVLRRSLKFGDGTKFGKNGIGRFGMGLPNSSLSQCRRVEVYTWTKSFDNVMYSYLDLDEILDGMSEVPKPTSKSIPNIWIKASKHISEKSGTLVVWSKLDKCKWRTSGPFIHHAGLIAGRIYRYFIHDKDISIRMTSCTDTGNVVECANEEYVLPNDPLYLMQPSSTPEPWDKEPMFKSFNEPLETKIPILCKNKEHSDKEHDHIVIVKYTVAKKKAREIDGKDAGNSPHGKHARDNTGISIVRAEREIDIDTSLVSRSESRERWWGAEIKFEPELDEFFGITNTKQNTMDFSDSLKSTKRIFDGDTDLRQEIADRKKDGDVEGEQMLKLANRISGVIQKMQQAIKQQRIGIRKPDSRHGHTTPETEAARKRKESGHEGGSDNGEEGIPKNERIESAKKALIEAGYDEKEAEEIARLSILSNEKFLWMETELSGNQFFDIVPVKGQLYIKISTKHAAYKNLLEILSEQLEDLDLDEAKKRLTRAHLGLKLLLASWARYEDEENDPQKKTDIQKFRIQWGDVLDDFLKENPPE
jgi:hypothetical protein